METPLPESIPRFFDASNGDGDAALDQCFTHDAIERDEGQE